MKTWLSISVLIIILIAGGCQKEEHTILAPVSGEQDKYGTASCDFGEQKWHGVVNSIVQGDLFSKNHEAKIFKTTTREGISFQGFNLEVGQFHVYDTIPINTDKAVTAVLDLGFFDSKHGYPHIIEIDGFENTFEITSVDLDKKMIAGKFQAAFQAEDFSAMIPNYTVIDPDSLFMPGDPFITITYPMDTILIKNGVFTTYLKD